MKKPFQATVVRYVHDVLTGEFVNIGVVLLCADRSYLGASFLSHWSRVTAAFPNAELPQVRRIASVIEGACAEEEARPNLSLWPPGDDVLRFLAKVIPVDDAAIQLSPVIRGVTGDPARTLAELRARYAEKYMPEGSTREARNEGQIWQDFLLRVARRGSHIPNLGPHTLRSPRSPGFHYDFDKAWKNGKWNIAQPLSLDLQESRYIWEKVALWSGRVMSLHPSEQNAQILFLVGMPSAEVSAALRASATEALEILHDNLTGEAQVFTEDRSDELVEKLEHDFAMH